MQRELKQYSKAWYEKMQMIWRDRLDAMNIRDTGKGYKRDGGDLKFLGQDIIARSIILARPASRARGLANRGTYRRR